MSTAITAALPLSLPLLPYAENALEPVIAGKTLSFQHGKHHRTYVDTANKLTVGTELADLPLDQIETATAGKADHTTFFRNAARAKH
jgi:Fe-Mn family superoxide dismutase